MSIYPIIKMGHPTLRKVSSPVASSDIDRPEMRTLIADMVETLHDAGGIGLAAPQIDRPIQLAIIEVPGGPSRYGEIEAVPLTAFFNPVLTVLDPAEAGYWKVVCRYRAFAVSCTVRSMYAWTTWTLQVSRHLLIWRAFWPPWFNMSLIT